MVVALSIQIVYLSMHPCEIITSEIKKQINWLDLGIFPNKIKSQQGFSLKAYSLIKDCSLWHCRGMCSTLWSNNLATFVLCGFSVGFGIYNTMVWEPSNFCFCGTVVWFALQKTKISQFGNPYSFWDWSRMFWTLKPNNFEISVSCGILVKLLVAWGARLRG